MKSYAIILLMRVMLIYKVNTSTTQLIATATKLKLEASIKKAFPKKVNDLFSLRIGYQIYYNNILASNEIFVL